MTAIRLVIDTNTVMALWHFHDPTLIPLRETIGQQNIVLLTRPDAIEELRLVLNYRQFGLTRTQQTHILDDYCRRCSYVDNNTMPTSALPICRDRDDQKFLEIARDGRASHLISRDKALVKLNRHRLIRPLFRIITPEVWCAEAAADLL